MDENTSNSRPTPILALGVFTVSIIGGILGGYSAMVAPINTEMENIRYNLRDTEARARTELDKAERGLKELTVRAEGIIRQTVEDVDNKLRREAGLIEEKSNIQFDDMRRQLEQLRMEIMLLRQQVVVQPPVVVAPPVAVPPLAPRETPPPRDGRSR
jgi:hypothetical protein